MFLFPCLVGLFFCGSLTFLIMTVMLSVNNIQEEDQDPSHFLLGEIDYEIDKEFGMDYHTEVPKFMTVYGYDWEFEELESGAAGVEQAAPATGVPVAGAAPVAPVPVAPVAPNSDPNSTVN